MCKCSVSPKLSICSLGEYSVELNPVNTVYITILNTHSTVLTSSSPGDVEEGQECKHVASALDIAWLLIHGHKLLTTT